MLKNFAKDRRLILRAIIAIALYAATMPGFAAAAGSIHAITGDNCLDLRSGERHTSPTMTASADGGCIDTAEARENFELSGNRITVRADGVLEPTIYLRWQTEPDIPDGIGRIIQILMLTSALIALAATIYLCIPPYASNNSRSSNAA